MYNCVTHLYTRNKILQVNYNLKKKELGLERLREWPSEMAIGRASLGEIKGSI